MRNIKQVLAESELGVSGGLAHYLHAFLKSSWSFKWYQSATFFPNYSRSQFGNLLISFSRWGRHLRRRFRRTSWKWKSHRTYLYIFLVVDWGCWKLKLLFGLQMLKRLQVEMIEQRECSDGCGLTAPPRTLFIVYKEGRDKFLRNSSVESQKLEIVLVSLIFNWSFYIFWF